MSEFKLSEKIAYLLPSKVLYWAIIRVWAKLTTEKYIDKTPDEVTIWMALKYLDA